MLYVLIYLGLSLSKVVKVSVDWYSTYFAKFILKCSSLHAIINDMRGALYETFPFHIVPARTYIQCGVAMVRMGVSALS